MKNICVYCGSSAGNNPLYTEAAKELGHAMLQRGMGLVYGGASIGLMGVLADTLLAGGGQVIGVIPQALARKEVAHEGLTELVVVHSMHERKMKMAEAADGFLSLPGGLGTLEELFETMSWAQLGLHAKPCALLNVDGYFNYLLSFLEHAVAAGFIKHKNIDMLLVADRPANLIEMMLTYQVPAQQQIINQSET